MDALLTALRAAAEPTRLRLLALAARGAFCVMDFTEILGQSQPRLSRHLKLLCDAGLLARVREGANVWFGLPPDAGLIRDVLARLPEDDPVLHFVLINVAALLTVSGICEADTSDMGEGDDGKVIKDVGPGGLRWKEGVRRARWCLSSGAALRQWEAFVEATNAIAGDGR